MKNLSAFPRFPHSEALMILITLVVCLAGFTKAEVNPNYSKQGPSLSNNFPDTHQASEMRGHELRGKHFFNLKNFPESFLDRPIKRQSDYYGDSSDSENEKESDGYGYDDDEYYHFNFKRNDEPDGKIDNSKSEKEIMKEQKNFNAMPDNNQANTKDEKDDKDDQHIEMLSYQESHPVIQQEPSDPLPNTKPFSDALAHSKSSPVSSLSGADFKENSAINENDKERNKQTETLAASDSKITEAKQDVKVTDAKDSNKLQDSKLTEDSEKKEKQVALKGEKDLDADKSLKENSNTSEDKEKAVKLTDNAKLKDSIDKISSSKSKVSESTKLTKEDKDVAKYNEKINSDVYNANTLSEISNGASFVGNDYKDTLDVLKSLRSEGHTKSYGESPENERSMTFGEYAKDAKESQDKLLKEKRISALKNERNRNYEFLAKQSSLIRALQGAGKSNNYGKNANFDYQSSNSFFKKPWREADKISPKFIPEFTVQTMQQKQEPPVDPGWNQLRHTLTNLPASELENTDYHRNYVKSLKKYKAQTENTKPPSGDGTYRMFSEETNICPKAKKKKRSKPKKRRSMGLEKKSENQEKSQSEKIRIRNQKRTAYSTDDSFADTVHECLKNPQSSQSLNVIKSNKEETNLSDDNKYFDQWNGNRQRRKSQKLEYEIKIINQKQPDMKNVKFSNFNPNRLKKDTKTKVVEDKYLKKYPYSQVSLDDLTKMSSMRDLKNEKKFKRKASIWKRDNQKSIIQTRAVPSGYYSNRVKFGQKNYVKNNEKTVADASGGDATRLPQTYFSQTPSEAKANFLQRSWENNQLDFAYEPGKRIEENEHLNLNSFPSRINPINPINSGNPANSLLLLKKDERMTKVLQDYPSKSSKETEIDPDQMVKMLPQDRNYNVFKNNYGGKLRKNDETESFPLNLNELERSSYASKQFPFLDSPTSEISENNGWSTPLKSLQVRSSNSEKTDQKYTSSFHDASTNSNLKKAIDKFRDMADFFQDSEQESSNNRYLIQEAKGRPDIVFSQDKLPDPIIINHEDTNKENGMKQEPVNSIYAISNNFRNLDQQTKKMEYPEVKFDSPDFDLKPSLKQAFPEAKSVNSVTRNGNEIIVLDLNGNPLRLDHEHIYKSPPKDQAHGMSRLLLFSPAQNLMTNGEDISVDETPLALDAQYGDQNKIKMNLLSNDRAVAIIRSADNQRDLPESLHELAELPEILKSIMIKVPMDLKSDPNLVNKHTSNVRSQSEAPQNYNQLQDFATLPGMKIKKEIILSSKGFPEQSLYSERNLENVLQSLLNPVGFKELNFDRDKNLNGNQKTEQKIQNTANYQPEFSVKRQNRWSTQEKNKNFIPFSQDMWENSLKPSEEISNILRIDGGSFTENNNESKLRKELAAASEKIHRLRREGMEAGKLRKTIEDTLAFKKTQDNDQSELKGEDNNKKYNSETVVLKSDDKPSIAQEAGNGKNLKSQLNEAEETKEGLESEKTSKSDYENNLSELFENLNSNKNQKNSKENTWSKKKRMDKSRRKRFSKRDFSSKVSKTEVQNKVVQSLVEDNDESVYSLGLKRKLLSISNEMEDSESNSDANKHDNNLNAKEIPEKPVKNESDESTDRSLIKLFSIDDNEAEKNRARRSAFHSNFKREIDLDESMPNDFQNFLMTSLGGFGSQKREVVKKGEALWEGKDVTQDNYNQIVENGKDPNEDSALEKREVSSSENLKSQNYKTPIYYGTANQEQDSINHADKTIRSVDTSMIKLKPTKFAEEKLPTRIRIQISNASTKKKKSSKPIMEENETTSTEMENLPKEKEFFDKNKVNPLLSRNFNKLRQHSGATYPDNEYDDLLNKNLGYKRKSYRPYWWEDRIRKKFTGDLRGDERKPMGFSEFDQNAVDSLVQNQQTNRDADQLAQKVSMITRLPQVETVYNPTQGANKAQIERSRLGKTNSVKSKTLLSTKNTLQSNEASSYDDGFLKPYLKAEEMKTDKGGAKDYGDPQWKILNEKMNLDQETFGTNSPSVPGQIGESVSFSGSNLSPVNFNNVRTSSLKWPQSHYSSYIYRGPSSSSIFNSQVMFDIMKLKQQMKNHNGYENYDLKYLKPMYATDNNDMQENMQKTKAANWLEAFPNNLDFSLNKKPPNDYLDSKNFEINGMKPQFPKDFGLFKHTYSIDGSTPRGLYEKPGIDTSQMYSMDNSKENDYIDGIEDDYPEMDARDPQPDDMYRMFFEDANKAHENPNYRNFYNYKNYRNGYKNPEADSNVNREEKELYEEYEENSEDEDPEDYSQLGYKKDIEPEMSGLPQDSPKLQGDIFRSLDNKYYNPFSQDFRGNSYEGNLLDPNSESNSNLAAPVENLKNDADLISGSTDLLKKANEKSNIFGKNLMKNLYRTNNNNDDVLNHMNKFRNEKSSEDTYHKYGNKLSKRKLNFPNTDSQIGGRVFYAAKVVSDDTKNLIPAKIFFPINKRNIKRNYYRLSGRNPFNAEFAGGENDFDHESGERGMRVHDNFVSLDKSGISQNEKNFTGFSEKNDEGVENVEDIEENVEGGGGDGNVLENVMGKYIMRKRIINSNDLSKTSEKAIKSQDNDKTTSDDSREHKITKRSVNIQRTDDQMPTILKKRWSSGHLTENNFRKYHKKNLTKKRHINDLLSIPYTFTGLIDDQENSMRTEKSKGQIKRSALDIFRKITNKDKDKRLENSDGRSAGFEPLLSLSEKSKGFIKDTKETNLFQDKQSSKEIPQTELRSNPPELKAHYPNEGQRLRAQIADRKKGKAKELEQVPLTKTSQGPWKVELNSRYDRPDLKMDNDLKDFKDAEKASVSNQNGRYKAFLVISNNANAAEQSAKLNHPSASNFFQSESSSYWPKSEECIRFSKNHVRKRSLNSTTDEKDAEETFDDHAIKKIDTENNNNNNNNIQEENTALQNTKSFPEENSKLQVPQVAQRSTKINRSFVTDPGGNRNWQFFSKGKLINRKSVFPPSSDSNNILVKSEKSEKSENHPRKINKRLTNPSQIIRDSRHINEETSEYHSQRIVDAILSQVSENSQFKKLIAPGLAMRTPAYKEGFDSKSKPKTEISFSDEFQSFLKKFVFDLENLAEQNVQKRMCKRIDDDLKEFLQTLLIPVENVNDNEMKAKQEKYSLESLPDTPQKKNLSQNDQNVHQFQKSVFDDLRNKQHIFKKILEKYQSLSKDTHNAKNSYSVQEINEKNKGSTILKNEPSSVPKVYFGRNNYHKANRINNKKGFDTKCNAFRNSTACHRLCKIFKSSGSKNLKFKSNPGSNIDLKPVTNTVQNKDFPFLYFYKVNNPNQEEEKTTTPAFDYEKTVAVNFTTLNTDYDNCTTPKNIIQNPVIILQKNGKTSQTFEIMSTTTKPNTETCPTVAKPVQRKNSKNVRTKHSLHSNKKLPRKSEWKVKDSSTTLTELKKFGLGDAAGLQLALKNRNSWVSNLEIGKTAMNVPIVKISEMVSSQQKGGTRVSQKNSASALSVDDFNNAQTFVDFYSDYSGDNNQNQNDNYCYFKRPHILVTSYRRIFQPEIKSVDNFTTGTIYGCNVTAFKPRFILVRVPVSSHAAPAFHASSGLHVPRKRCRKRKFKKKNRISKKINVVPRFLTHHRKSLKEVPERKN